MKKIFLIIAAIFVCSFANAQTNIVKVSPTGVLLGSFKATFEHSLNVKNSIVISGRYLNLNDAETLFGSSEGKITGFDVDLSYRHYFSKNSDAPKGLFFFLFFNVQSLKTDYTCGGFWNSNPNPVEATYNYFGVATGVVAGHQWLFDSGLVIDLFFGYGYLFTSTDKEENENRPCAILEYYNGGIPKFDIAIGYKF